MSIKKLYKCFPADIDTKAFNSKMRVQREWHRTNVRIITEALDFNGKTALDAGCGSGALDFDITSKFDTHITGIDFNDQAIRFAREKSKKRDSDNLIFITASCENIPLKDSSFDTVFSCELLEHLMQPQTALKEMHRVCKKGGEIVCITQNWRSLWPIVQWFWDRFGDGRNYEETHVSQFTPKNLHDMLDTAGFKIEKYFTIHNVTPFFHLVTNWHPRKIEKYMSERCLGLTLVIKGRAV